MANPKISMYEMTVENGRYTFLHQDGYLSVRIEGTPKEIAYKIFDSYINTHTIQQDSHMQDGYYHGWPAGYDVLGPFALEISGRSPDHSFDITVDWLAAIRPEPPPEFWEELKTSFGRYINLVIFS